MASLRWDLTPVVTATALFPTVPAALAAWRAPAAPGQQDYSNSS